MNKSSYFRKKLFTGLLWLLGVVAIPLVAKNPEAKTIRSGAALSEVIAIEDKNFGTDAIRLTVFFSATNGIIQTTINNQLLEVKAPAGTTYEPISVINTTSGRPKKKYYVVLEEFADFNTADAYKKKILEQKYNADIFYYEKEKKFYVYVFHTTKAREATKETQNLKNYTKLKEARVLTVEEGK